MLYVLDCSVAVKWFLPEPLADKATSLLERFRTGLDSLFAPDILISEFGHVLTKRHRRHELTETEVQDIWNDFMFLGVQTEGTSPLATDALQLAVAHTAKFYDAVYVALAQVRGCVVITADDSMIAAFHSLGCLLRLQDLPS